MNTISIQYCFKYGEGLLDVYDLQLDAKSFELHGNIPDTLPSWTKLDYNQCPNCTLDIRNHPNCPIAANLVNIVNRFDSLLSHNEVQIEITTEERKVSHETTVQRAVGSLLGLVIATSGCPHAGFFKPMARFHLPLANTRETVYRAASMYLLAQYFLNKEGKEVDLELKGLQKIYKNIQLVNFSVAERLRIASKTDSVLNAIVELDIFAQTLSFFFEESLEELSSLFDSYLKKGDGTPNASR
jgi:hypothetical protein